MDSGPTINHIKALASASGSSGATDLGALDTRTSSSPLKTNPLADFTQVHFGLFCAMPFQNDIFHGVSVRCSRTEASDLRRKVLDIVGPQNRRTSREEYRGQVVEALLHILGLGCRIFVHGGESTDSGEEEGRSIDASAGWDSPLNGSAVGENSSAVGEEAAVGDNDAAMGSTDSASPMQPPAVGGTDAADEASGETQSAVGGTDPATVPLLPVATTFTYGPSYPARRLLTKTFRDPDLEFQEMLGRGTFAKVYRAKFREQPVAVKVSPADPMISWVPEHAKLELAALEALEHPNIIKCVHFYHNDFNTQFVLELFETDLNKYVRVAAPLASHVAQSIASKLLAGLEYMHDQGFMHRDLKPGNIFMNKIPLAVVIGDLGACTNQTDRREVRTSTPYKAPELFLEPPKPYTFCCDLWSLGLIFAEMEVRDLLPFHLLHPVETGRGVATEVQLEHVYMSGLVKNLCGHAWGPSPLDSNLLSIPLNGYQRHGLPLGNKIGWMFGRDFTELVEAMANFSPELRQTPNLLQGYRWLMAPYGARQV